METIEKIETELTDVTVTDVLKEAQAVSADPAFEEKVVHEEVLTAEQLAERQKALRELKAFMQKQQKRRRPIGSSLLCNMMRRI